jgi:hypothetical protein
VTHAKAVNALLEQSSKTGFIPGLASGSSDAAYAAKVDAFAARTLPPASRGDASDVSSQIRYRAGLRKMHEPNIAGWTK